MFNASYLLLSLLAATLTVNVKDGEAITAERTVRVTVKSDKPVTQVEYYAGEDLRDSDTSTPYEFKIDPLSEEEGDLKLTFKAYTEEGEAGTVSVTVKIDAGVSKGADFHVERAREFLTNSKWDEAILAGRIALRAKPGHNPARIVMARAYLGKGVLDRAQQLAEDALASDPAFLEASDLLSAITLRRAFSTFSRTPDRSESLRTIGTALKSAIETRRKALDAQVDAFGEATDDNRLRYADVAIRAGRYKTAIGTLQPAYNRLGTAELGTRLAYAQLRAGMFKESFDTIRRMKRERKMTGYASGLEAILETHSGNTAAADQAMKDALGEDPGNPAVQLAQAYIALKRGDVNRMGAFAASVARENEQLPAANYYLYIHQNRGQQFQEANRSFERSVMSEPALHDLYIEKANSALLPIASGKATAADEVRYQMEVASIYFDLALAARPDSPEALTGKALMFTLQNKPDDALRFAQAAIAAAPSYPSGAYAASMIFAGSQSVLVARAEQLRSNKGINTPENRAEYDRLKEQAVQMGNEAVRQRNLAGELDRSQLGGRGTPKLADVFDYYYRHGRIALLPPPK